jgi:hypothetical protein
MQFRTQSVAQSSAGGKFNRFLATLPPGDLALLKPHLQDVSLDLGRILHAPDGDLENVYFPHSGWFR